MGWKVVKPHTQHVPGRKVGKGERPAQAGELPLFISVGNRKAYVGKQPKPLTKWGSFPYQVEPPEGWVQINGYHQTRVLRDGHREVIACGEPQCRNADVHYDIYAHPDDVYPVPQNPIHEFQGAPSFDLDPKLGVVHSFGERYTISTEEPLTDAQWFELGRCRVSEDSWVGPLRMGSTCRSMFKLPAKVNCLKGSGLSNITGYMLDGQVHVETANLSDPKLAAAFFEQPNLEAIPQGAKLQGLQSWRPGHSEQVFGYLKDLHRIKNHARREYTFYTKSKPLDCVALAPDTELGDPQDQITLPQKRVLAVSKAALKGNYLSLAQAARKFGKVGNAPFGTWIREQGKDFLRFWVEADGTKLNVTDSGFISLEDEQAILELTDTARDWKEALEKEFGITFPAELLPLIKDAEEARKWMMFQVRKAQEQLVHLDELTEWIAQFQGANHYLNLSCFRTITEPITHQSYSALPVGKSMDERVDAYFKEHPEAVLQFFEGIRNGLPQLIHRFWGHPQEVLLTVSDI